MKLTSFFIWISLVILPFANEIKSQTVEEIENRIAVEIRDTHILVVHLFQSEIEGTITRSGSLARAHIHGEERIVAQSVIQTNKSLEQIKVDVQNVLNRVDPDRLKMKQGIPWSDHPTDRNEKWTYWILTDPYTSAKFYFEITYKLYERELLYTSYVYDF